MLHILKNILHGILLINSIALLLCAMYAQYAVQASDQARAEAALIQEGESQIKLMMISHLDAHANLFAYCLSGQPRYKSGYEAAGARVLSHRQRLQKALPTQKFTNNLRLLEGVSRFYEREAVVIMSRRDEGETNDVLQRSMLMTAVSHRIRIYLGSSHTMLTGETVKMEKEAKASLDFVFLLRRLLLILLASQFFISVFLLLLPLFRKKYEPTLLKMPLALSPIPEKKAEDKRDE